MRGWFARIFTGRRGPDAVCGVLFCVGLALSAVAWFTHNQVLGWLVYLPWALAVVRMFSTDLERRYQENRRFLDGWSRVKQAVKGLGQRLHGTAGGFGRPAGGEARADGAAQAAASHHCACPAGGHKLRVPRGRGRVLVTCPKCGREFIERT